MKGRYEKEIENKALMDIEHMIIKMKKRVERLK